MTLVSLNGNPLSFSKLFLIYTDRCKALLKPLKPYVIKSSGWDHVPDEKLLSDDTCQATIQQIRAAETGCQLLILSHLFHNFNYSKLPYMRLQHQQLVSAFHLKT